MSEVSTSVPSCRRRWAVEAARGVNSAPGSSAAASLVLCAWHIRGFSKQHASSLGSGNHIGLAHGPASDAVGLIRASGSLPGGCGARLRAVHSQRNLTAQSWHGLSTATAKASTDAPAIHLCGASAFQAAAESQDKSREQTHGKEPTGAWPHSNARDFSHTLSRLLRMPPDPRRRPVRTGFFCRRPWGTQR